MSTKTNPLPKASGVYRIRSLPTDRCYVGSATTMSTRWNGHLYNLRHNSHHSPRLQYEWNKYGGEAFEVTVLELCAREALKGREQYWLDATVCDFNVSREAHTPVHTPEVRQKLKITSKRKGERFLVKGEFLAVSDILTRYGVMHTVFYQRLRRGWSVEKAATAPPEKKHTAEGARVHEYKGKLYTLQELVPLAHCSKTALFRRLRSGMAVAEAVEMTTEQANRRRANCLWVARRKNKQCQ